MVGKNGKMVEAAKCSAKAGLARLPGHANGARHLAAGPASPVAALATRVAVPLFSGRMAVRYHSGKHPGFMKAFVRRA